MAINPNNSLDNNHTCYCGASGAGKTVAVKRFGLVGRNAALFDPYGDYRASRVRKLSGLGGRPVHHYKTRNGFKKAFIAAWSSGRSFAVAYQPDAKGDALRVEALWFGKLMWAASDGNRRLDLVFEETGKYTDTTGAERSILGEIASGGRKFGLVAHWVFQRPSEVPKTLIANATRYVVGEQQAMLDARRWQAELDCSIDEIVELGQLNKKRTKYFLDKTKGIGNYKKVSVSF
ncbi:hypothetical protein [Shewanella fidelis]|uniref:ATP-binding protein n=1 Tax=Shewanella fidelis TaxID=173509 RepID=A0AAW8NKR7_9GAMM|nr:hypothetical protein [Shewanella fidelis]MDR8523847.1 hypothetical protein [Shewanella fidelis]MDW4810395.1 hypothetical protein [Shewanella fidelis]MDW4823718.1 hypothetical protein [Shewanella fidelis]